MPLELNISPEDIEALVRDSIMRSGFGKAVNEGVQKALSGYNNPLDEAIKRYVLEVAGTLLREKCGDQVRAALLTAMEKHVTADILDKITEAAIQKMIRAAEDRY